MSAANLAIALGDEWRPCRPPWGDKQMTSIDEFIRANCDMPSRGFIPTLITAFPTCLPADLYAALLRVASDARAEAEDLRCFQEQGSAAPNTGEQKG